MEPSSATEASAATGNATEASAATGNVIVTALDEQPGDTGPLAGWRVGVKDNIGVAGVRSTRGSAFFADHVAVDDAEVVTRMRAAGAGITATLNMAEFALGVTSQNSVHGGVVNPWDPGRIPGGSSGGSGAAVAAGLVDAALGTDTGGSVRLPASMCGVTGLRPTYGTVPEAGIFPCCPETDATGPLTRTARRRACSPRCWPDGIRSPRNRTDPTSSGSSPSPARSTRPSPRGSTRPSGCSPTGARPCAR